MGVHQTRELYRAGIGNDAIRRRVRAGELRRLRRGGYCDDDLPGDLDEHRALIAATLPQLAPDAVLSHFSAGVLHGFAVPRSALAKVWISRNSGGGGHLGPTLHELKAAFLDTDVAEVAGYRVTNAARTVIDIARRGTAGYGLAAADTALASGVSPEELLEQIERWPGRPGMRRARLAAELADPLSESYGESLSRLIIWQLDLPMPVLQLPISGMGFAYRCDFAWPELGVLGEFDGRVKYDGSLGGSRVVAEVVMAEKRREQDLRSLGWEVVRWGMDELREPSRLKERIEAGFRRAARSALRP
jgi:hypothetical protein